MKINDKLGWFLLGIVSLLTASGPIQAQDQNARIDQTKLNNTSATASNGLIDIGNGRKMYLISQGEGFPTVVLVSGRSNSADIWISLDSTYKQQQSVFSEVSKFTRVCAYDRPGTITFTSPTSVQAGRSTLVPQPITPKNGVDDLHALLTAAKVSPPYVLVGHSYGGLIVRLFASIYPEEVAGLVLIDVATEMMYEDLPAKLKPEWIRLNSNYSAELDTYTIQEKTDFVPSFQQLAQAQALRPMPAIVLTSDQPYDFKALIKAGILPSDTPIELGARIFQAHLKGQEQLAKLLNAKHITNTHAGHYIQNEQPQVVIDAIKEVVEKVRKENPKELRINWQ